ASIDKLGVMPSGRVRESAAAAVTLIERSTRVDWLPMTALVEVLDATLAVLGPDDAAVHWRRSTLRSLEIPLVKPFLDGVLSLFNPSPALAMPLYPKLFSLLYRNVGGVAVEVVEPGLLIIEHSELPSLVLTSPAWASSMAASYDATLHFLRAKSPRVSFTIDAAKGSCPFTLRYTPDR
ncbi:MAG TPA: hypothetical protein VIA18_14695, partial [Polyangia bacterium]|nr:hypothetical protein [Polyangia bacterium]